jgi:hypothetical protein
VGELPDVNLDPQGFGAKAAAVGDVIYFGPEANGETQFFGAFDTSPTGAGFFQLPLPPGTESDFCACGYTDVFVADHSSIYMLGNDGYRYDPSTNQWFPFPVYLMYSRGEAAAAYDFTSRSIFLVGGRNTPFTTIRITIPDFGAESIVLDPGRLPGVQGANSARAWVPTDGSLMYVAGGQTHSGRALWSRGTAPGADQWTRLSDAPVDLGTPTGMGEHLFDGKIWLWVANQDSLYFYDRETNTWSERGLPAPEGMVLVVTANSGTYAFVQNVKGLEVYKLDDLSGVVPNSQAFPGD